MPALPARGRASDWAEDRVRVRSVPDRACTHAGCRLKAAILANGENRRYLALAFGGALLAAVGTKLGEWGIEEIRKFTKRPAETTEKTTQIARLP